MAGEQDKEVDIVRYWKDEQYRNSLTPEQRAGLPEHPAGEAELSDEMLDSVSGGMRESLSTDPKCYSVRTEIQGCTCPS